MSVQEGYGSVRLQPPLWTNYLKLIPFALFTWKSVNPLISAQEICPFFNNCIKTRSKCLKFCTPLFKRLVTGLRGDNVIKLQKCRKNKLQHSNMRYLFRLFRQHCLKIIKKEESSGELHAQESEVQPAVLHLTATVLSDKWSILPNSMYQCCRTRRNTASRPRKKDIAKSLKFMLAINH